MNIRTGSRLVIDWSAAHLSPMTAGIGSRIRQCVVRIMNGWIIILTEHMLNQRRTGHCRPSDAVAEQSITVAEQRCVLLLNRFFWGINSHICAQ